MISKKPLALAVAIPLLLAGLPARADTLHVASDTMTNPASPNQKNGTNSDLIVRNTLGDRYGFVRFDLSPIPAGTAIARASLRLYARQVLSSGIMDVKLVQGAWDEATLTHATTPSLGAVVASLPLSSGEEGDYVLVDVTSAVQQWMSGTPNNGFQLIGNAGTVLRVTFDSKEAPETGHAPELEVVPVGPAGPQGPVGPQGPAGAVGPQGPGSVTLVNSGTGLLGGPITGTGTLSLNTAFTDARYFGLNASNAAFGQQTFTNNAGASAIVGFSTQPNSAHAILGYAQATSGPTAGLVGASASDARRRTPVPSSRSLGGAKHWRSISGTPG